jgi:tetratricopeptide (TPR) repeat protein
MRANVCEINGGLYNQKKINGVHMHSKLAKITIAAAQFSFIIASSSLPLDISAAGKSAPALQDLAETKDEAFFVRRIAEFWKDEDYKLVKLQIQQFLKQFPNSKIRDYLKAILADLYLQEEAYKDALAAYTAIKDPVIREKTLINKLQCYYELNEFDEIIREGAPYLTKKSGEVDVRKNEFQFLMAEAYFRSAVTKDVGDKKTKYIEQAKPLYEGILHSSFNDPAMFALAEIYRITGDYKKASTFFSELSQRHSEREDELLFHAAVSQAEYDRALAITTFSQIIEKGGAKAEEASLNRLVLYFQEDRFQDVLSSYPEVLTSIEKEKQLSLDYIIGRSHFAQKNFEEASHFLTRYISSENVPSPQLRNSLLMLMSSAQNMNNEELYNQTITELQDLFPQDNELPQAIFIHSMMLKEAGNFNAAEEKLEYLITYHPNFEDTQTLFLEYSLVTYTNQKWEKSHATLLSFVRHYPESVHNKIAWKYLLSCSLNLLKEVETNTSSNYTRKDFLEDLSSVIAQEGVLNEQEKKECRFLQGRISYELGLYDQALVKFNQYLEDYKSDPSIGETHLLIALCHHQTGKQPVLFCKHSEEALKIDPDLKNKASIHLELYNAYLSIIEKGEASSNLNQEEYLSFHDLAAEHLYQAMSLQDLPIKIENRLWLANYYYDKVFKPTHLFEAIQSTLLFENDENYQRSYKLFDEILNKSEKLVTLDQEHAYLEWEVLKFAKLLGRDQKLERKVDLLKALIEQQQAHRSWDWKLQKETLLELAKTYEYMQDSENAYETYAFIRANHSNAPTFVSEFASLHANRLEFHLLPERQQREENEKVIDILNYLKELQIRKHVHSEPIHLEAALEYAWIRAHLVDEEEKDIRYLFFLNRVKEDYNNFEDPNMVRYNEMLKKQAEKKEIHDLYMQFIEAEILRTKAIIAQKENNMSKADELNKKTIELLSECKSSSVLTHYLYNRAQKSQNAIEAHKLY